MTPSEEFLYKHPSGDQALSVLSGTSGLIGELVRTYPGKINLEASPHWLEDWFQQRTQTYYSSAPTSKIDTEGLEERLANIFNQPTILLSTPIKILSILPHFFRGFRDPAEPINLSGDLLVIDGRNSSGKTSLAEAFEWLLTGQLLRRSMQQYGDARELECCIANQFKPDGEETWVEAVFAPQDNTRFRLRRILRRDYGATQTSRPDSILILDGKELSTQEEAAFLDTLFAGIPPILMQHSLRLFVHSSPSDRRNYFERLLRLDELTYLIERAVVGNARFVEFPSPTGSVALKRWESLKGSIRSKDSGSVLRKVERSRSEDLLNNLRDAIIRTGQIEFGEMVLDQNDLDQIKATLTAIQKIERQKSFPLLEKLRHKQTIDDFLENNFSSKQIEPVVDLLQKGYPKFVAAKNAADMVGEAQIVVAKVLEDLKEVGLISDLPEPQICPLCDYRDLKTLTNNRLQVIQSWQPIQKAAEEAANEFFQRKNDLLNLVTTFQMTRENLLPGLPTEEEKAESLSDINEKLLEAASKCIKELQDSLQNIDEFDKASVNLKYILGQLSLTEQDLSKIINNVSILSANFKNVLQASRNYHNAFSELDKFVGSQAREDPDYNLRELWLSVSEDLNAVIADLGWEQAKVLAQSELERIRGALILARKKLLEQRRTDFSSGMTTIWKKLRADRYSSFSQLIIPEPRGKGFPVEIEVKALLDDGAQQIEVDALRVFSESQINVLGIAAFSTRSKMLGHRLLILDDPVQSMDEDHFKTFARELLPELLSNDTQVIILTHNDTFAKELSYAWYEMDQYVTMQIRHSRRMGCLVEEGNRRVSERLKKAEKDAEEGKFPDAWRCVRLALERLCTVTHIKHGPANFNALSWTDQTAEYMWDDGSGNGVGVIIEKMIPGSDKRLKEILSMTAAGAHDKSAKGFTDLMNAINYIRSMLPILRIGNG